MATGSDGRGRQGGSADETERKEVLSLVEVMENPSIKNKNTLLARFGQLMSKADSYNTLPDDNETFEFDFNINQKVWAETGELRRSGSLLESGKNVRCPVIAIHGDYDPHPAAGVNEPLSHIIKNFRFFLLKNCGHKPWVEKDARDDFYRILKKNIA